MIENLSIFNEDMLKASKLGKDVEVNLNDYNNVVVCGIGGSGVTGEFLIDLNLKIPVIAVKENFPNFANKRTLCFIVSH
ncbi:MAG: hypothetical protein QXJ28_02715, partial [Candidatus Pacearchaeota archaeon]